MGLPLRTRCAPPEGPATHQKAVHIPPKRHNTQPDTPRVSDIARYLETWQQTCCRERCGTVPTKQRERSSLLQQVKPFGQARLTCEALEFGMLLCLKDGVARQEGCVAVVLIALRQHGGGACCRCSALAGQTCLGDQVGNVRQHLPRLCRAMAGTKLGNQGCCNVKPPNMKLAELDSREGGNVSAFRTN